MEDNFKIPSTTLQDLLIIQDLVADQIQRPIPVAQPTKPVQDDCIDSSGEESGNEGELSEDEVVADLLLAGTENGLQKLSESDSEPSSSDSDSDSDSSSDTDSVPDVTATAQKARPNAKIEDDEDDENGTSLAPGELPQTKHEVKDVGITIPDITEVGQTEVLEKVGEVISTMEKLAIVRGAPSEVPDRGSDRALDSETLLVFDDRKVLGYIYETFGPTSLPFYQVKFTSAYPLDPEKVRVGRDVFHVPARSRFVFLNEIKRFKGSDASNLYDEEPADHELEFSDDEAEAEFKRLRKRKRGDSRAGSVASSRFSTPVPSQMHDQDIKSEFPAGDAYTAYGPYDSDFGAGPSRPPPMPYDDDPYAEPLGSPNVDIKPPFPKQSLPLDVKPPFPKHEYSSPELPDQSRDRGSQYDRDRGWASDRGGSRPPRGRGRGQGRGRGRGESFSRGRGRGRGTFAPGPRQDMPNSAPSNPPPEGGQPARPLSPTSLAIARATGQYHDNSNPASSTLGNGLGNAWSYQAQYSPFEPLHQPYVQPHINPRFASMFGFQMPPSAPQPYMTHGQGANVGGHGRAQQPSDWADQWTVHRPDGGNAPQ
ncbi:hypothetical protein HGRIS_008281 [Hohenbuehelia grisea]|uniref:H/ACA ribonucleoprotein complex non-core subunit NAF1 n=1 Tax=Hohenbuehelia grisea TaxID=104357 RepID=A0ABR3J7H7_9AGAR